MAIALSDLHSFNSNMVTGVAGDYNAGENAGL
jgi:hypothetical protein